MRKTIQPQAFLAFSGPFRTRRTVPPIYRLPIYRIASCSELCTSYMGGTVRRVRTEGINLQPRARDSRSISPYRHYFPLAGTSSLSCRKNSWRYARS